MDQQRMESGIKKVLLREKDRCDHMLSNKDVEGLLRNSGHKGVSVTRTSIIGYPTYPLYKELAAMLLLWLKTGKCPALDLPTYFMLDEKEFIETRRVRIDAAKLLLDGINSFCDFWTEEEIIFRIREILVVLGKRGILDLLGVRQTVGTLDLLPPSRSILIETFVKPHSQGSALSVGARALAKHGHRDTLTTWWGQSTGPDAEKNQHALNIVSMILEGAAWINTHQIVHDVQLLEARQEKGYGARWTADGKSFRGFLEPQMIDGHDIGWKH